MFCCNLFLARTPGRLAVIKLAANGDPNKTIKQTNNLAQTLPPHDLLITPVVAANLGVEVAQVGMVDTLCSVKYVIIVG